MALIAQLIKLQDYISRYEWDTFRYPTQYIRLKKNQWDKLYVTWSEDEEVTQTLQEELPVEEEDISVFSKIKDKFTKKKEPLDVLEEDTEEGKQELPETELELKQYFLDNLLNFQMKWATSTVAHRSFVRMEYYNDPILKYLLQRFPDTYLIMYHPIFTIKKAPIETDILLISPIGIEIIHFIEYEEDAVIMAGNERTWHIESGDKEKKVLNPIIALSRTEKIVKSILVKHELEFDIKKTVLSRKNNIISATDPYSTSIIGKMDYEDWFKAKRRLASPLKNTQIKAAEVLLKQCQTTSVKRPEWEEDTGPLTIMDMEE